MRGLPFLPILLLVAACSSGAAPQANSRPGGTAEGPPPAVRQACELAGSIAHAMTGVTTEAALGSFTDERAKLERNGCTISVAGSFAALLRGKDIFDRWREAFAARGWQEQPEYAADGPDGTAFAFASRGVICLFQGRWDGGDDAEPDAPRDDGYRGSASCAASGPDTISPSRR